MILKITSTVWLIEKKDSMLRNLGVCHADDLFYMWDMYGLNSELGLLDAWWSQENKLNSKR